MCSYARTKRRVTKRCCTSSQRLASRWSPLPPLLAQWQEQFPGLAGEPSSLGVCLRLPPALEFGHESQFALVLNTFLDHLDRGTWPQALPARIRMRYTLLAQAQDLGWRQRQGASP